MLLSFSLCFGPLAHAAPDPITSAGFEQKLGAQVDTALTFRDEDGRPIALRQCLAGKPTLLILAWYQCPNLCTLVLNAALESMQALKLEAGRDFSVVIVSIDPTETPALARAKKATYLRQYDRPDGQSGWHFLTGEAPSISRLAEGVGFRFAYDPITCQYAHPSGFAVLTPEGQVSRYFAGIEYPPRELHLALVEASHRKIGSLTDRFFLLCYHYNPATGKYGLAIHHLLQAAGLATVAALGGFVFVSHRRERASP